MAACPITFTSSVRTCSFPSRPCQAERSRRSRSPCTAADAARSFGARFPVPPCYQATPTPYSSRRPYDPHLLNLTDLSEWRWRALRGGSTVGLGVNGQSACPRHTSHTTLARATVHCLSRGATRRKPGVVARAWVAAETFLGARPHAARASSRKQLQKSLSAAGRRSKEIARKSRCGAAPPDPSPAS